MDDTSQKIASDQASQQPVVQPGVAADQPVQATSSTSIGPGHEGEPISTKKMTEYASTPELQLHPEVAAAGVETVNSETIDIPEEAAAVGVTPGRDGMPVASDHTKWPMTPQKANAILTSPHIVIKNAAVWLATIIKKMVKKEAAMPAKEEIHVSTDA